MEILQIHLDSRLNWLDFVGQSSRCNFTVTTHQFRACEQDISGKLQGNFELILNIAMWLNLISNQKLELVLEKSSPGPDWFRFSAMSFVVFNKIHWSLQSLGWNQFKCIHKMKPSCLWNQKTELSQLQALRFVLHKPILLWALWQEPSYHLLRSVHNCCFRRYCFSFWLKLLSEN